MSESDDYDEPEESFDRRVQRRITSTNARPTRAIIRAPRKITNRSGTYSGKGMLTAELLVGFVIILIRIIADFTIDDTTGKLKSNVLHNSGEYGPMPIATGLIGVFFILSFLAASGGKKAKAAVVFGGVVVTALGVKSVPQIGSIATYIGSIGTYQVPAASGTEGSGASSPITPVLLPGTNPIVGTGSLNPAGTQNTATIGTGTAPVQPGTPPGDHRTDASNATCAVNPGGTNVPAGTGTPLVTPLITSPDYGTLLPSYLQPPDWLKGLL